MRTLLGLAALTCMGIVHAQLPTLGNMPTPAGQTTGSNVRYQTIASGNDATSKAQGLFLFNDATGWQNYWRAHHQGPMPNLEQGFFLKWRIVAVHAGTRPTGGYGLAVGKIQKGIDRALISMFEVTPPRRGPRTQALTAPWIVLKVERGAYDFALQMRQVEGYASSGGGNGNDGSTVQVGGATVTFGPGVYGGGRRGGNR